MVELPQRARLTILPDAPEGPSAPRLLPAAAPGRELDLLKDWSDPDRTNRLRYAVIGSLLFHSVLFVMGTRISSLMSSEDVETTVIVHRTPLYFPPELTQKAANKNKLTERFSLQDLLAAQIAHQQQAAAAARRKFIPKAGSPVIPQRTVQPQITAEAPVIVTQNTANVPLPGSAAGILPPSVAPPPQSSNPFENIGQQPVTKPTMSAPRASVQDAIRGLSHNPNGIGMVISDDSPGITQAPMPGMKSAPGRMGSQVELKSDPLGADLKPYLIEVLSIVKRNWLGVIPESARLGTRRGRTVVEFAVNRDGTLAKVVISDYSGSDPLDRAAVAGLSMSNPLPPLPKEYRGMQVRLALSFNYNVANGR